MAEPIKIAFLAQLNNSKNMGGADIHIQNILKELSKIEELEIHLITLSKTIDKTTTRIENGITYHILKSPQLPRTITAITMDHRALIKKVHEIKPDLIHAQILGAPYGLAAMKLYRKYPTVLTVHTLVDMDAMHQSGTVKERIHDGIWRKLERKEIKRIPNFIAVSKSIEEELKKRGARNVHVIPNGISENWFNVQNNEIDGRILFVGRIMPIKGLETLIQAIKTVKMKHSKAHLHIVGAIQDREYKHKLDSLIGELGLEDSVIFLGPRSGADLEKEYSECAVFVLPSKNESFGIVLLEAMATGKSIVASNVGGIPEILENGKEGVLVKSGDTEELAKKIQILLSENEIRKKMGLAGIENAKKCSWQSIAERTLDYYKKILGDSR